MLWGLIAVIITLMLVVGLHEAGHAVVARLFGVKIQQISIGFGKPLFRWHKRAGYDLVWALWPLGGSVSLLNSRIHPVAAKEYSQCFDKQSTWKRISILLAGSLTNLLVAWLAMVLVFLIGMPHRIPLVQQVEPQSMAAQAGMQAGDRIVAINQQTTASWREIGMQLVELWGNKDVSFQVQASQDTAARTLHLDLSQVKFAAHKANLLETIGIQPDKNAPKSLSQVGSLGEAIQKTNCSLVKLTYFFVYVLKQMITGVIPFSVLLGPLGLFAITISSFTQGFAVFMYFIATLSLSVAWFNLLPIPVLDGGSIVYTLIEKIRGQPISVALELLIHRLFLIAFFVLLVHLLNNDLARILQ